MIYYVIRNTDYANAVSPLGWYGTRSLTHPRSCFQWRLFWTASAQPSRGHLQRSSTFLLVSSCVLQFVSFCHNTVVLYITSWLLESRCLLVDVTAIYSRDAGTDTVHKERGEGLCFVASLYDKYRIFNLLLMTVMHDSHGHSQQQFSES
jgi:hypothetical protein